MDNFPISSLPIEQLYIELQSSADGLTAEQASKRNRERLKSDKPETRFRRELRILLRQFLNPLVLLLAIAVILAAILGESSDAFIILFILMITGLVGFWQEANAGRAFEKLRKMIENKHDVLREGREIQVTSQQIASGDILLLKAGDIIPADCRIVESNELHVNESTLTGESYPVEKMIGEVPDNASLTKKHNCLWQGTNVVSGTAKALVVQTGNQTYFGKMARSLAQTPETAFEKGIRRFGYFLLHITVILSLVILIANLYFKRPLFGSVLFSLSLAVGMAPELLPAIMTFVMSAGARRMMKKKVIVKKLSSIFNFGEVNILCTDKTGTITEGNIKVKGIVGINGKTNNQIQVYAWLNASLQNGFTNPIDEAISSLNFNLPGYDKINEVPYDFIRKRLSVAVEYNTRRFFITKGAFVNVLDVCSQFQSEDLQVKPLDDSIRQKIEQQFVFYSKQGYRTLGLAYKELIGNKVSRQDEQQMTFLGYILLEDPLKETTQSSIERLKQLQIKTKIITGDNQHVALNIAREIGIENQIILSGEEMNSLSPESLMVKVVEIDVFAEIEPQQKELIIKALQKSKFTVAYIGDGINDVAAINAADIGISTNNAVDIAKEAADFVLLDKDLGVIADGIDEGRKSFVNSMKYIFINTGATFGNMLGLAGASLLLPFLPMLPKQILLINLLTDVPFLTIASDNVDAQQLEKPGSWDIKMIRNFMIIFGLHSTIFDFLTFYVLYVHLKLTDIAFQTGWFWESTITQLLITFIIRTRKPLFKSEPGRLLLITSIISLAITILLPISPFAGMLGFVAGNSQQLLFLFIILVAFVVTAEITKIIFFRFGSNNRSIKQT